MKTTFFLKKRVILGMILLFLSVSISLASNSILGKTHLPLSDAPANKTLAIEETTIPDCVEIGDLVLIDFLVDQSNLWKQPGLYNEHGAIYIGNNTLVEANGIVRFRNYSHFHEWQQNLVFLRVKTANESQKHAAVAWAITMVGSSYQNFFDFPWFGFKIADTTLPIKSAKKIYCMELLWAAYYQQGIDIDRNGWMIPCWVTGNDILYDDDIEIIYQEINHSTEISKPYKGIFCFNRKILYNPFFTMIIGNIDIIVNTANEHITRVDFYIDSVYKATDTTPPYVWRWEEPCFGKKLITAIASDDIGNSYQARIKVMKYF